MVCGMAIRVGFIYSCSRRDERANAELDVAHALCLVVIEVAEHVEPHGVELRDEVLYFSESARAVAAFDALHEKAVGARERLLDLVLPPDGGGVFHGRWAGYFF